MERETGNDKKAPARSVLAIIPAHNEVKNLEITIRGLKSQMYPVTICVVSDNSTDETVALAKKLGADIVTETVGNTGMRAGAINWGFNHFSDGFDYVLAMDADTTCDKYMISEGVKALESDSLLGAVCSRAGVLPQPELKSLFAKFLWHCQHVEYAEYDSARVETDEKIKTAHGMATLFRKEALDTQKNDKGYVYNPTALTEDYWLTIDLKLRGWKISSCQTMNAWTIVPTRLHWLWKQRSRWQLGGLDAIVSHGLSWVTFWDIVGLIAGLVMLLINVFLTIVIVYVLSQGGEFRLSSLLYAVYLIVWVDSMYRLKYVQDITLWDVLIKATLIPYALYGLLHVAVQANAYRQYVMNTKRSY